MEGIWSRHSWHPKLASTFRGNTWDLIVDKAQLESEPCLFSLPLARLRILRALPMEESEAHCRRECPRSLCYSSAS